MHSRNLQLALWIGLIALTVGLRIPRIDYSTQIEWPDSVYVRADYHIVSIRDYALTIRLDHLRVYDEDFQLAEFPSLQSLWVRDYRIESDSLYRIRRLEFRTSAQTLIRNLSRSSGPLPLSSNLMVQPIFEPSSEIENWRQTVLEFYRRQFRQQLIDPVDRIAQAVILNQTQYLDHTIKDVFRYSGLYPILVISGLHFAMIFMVIRWMLYFCPGFRWKRIVIIVVLSLYLGLIGWKSSLGRAYLMILLYQTAPLVGRRIDKYQALFFSAWLIGMIDPLEIGRLGFQLTYLATLGIMIMIDCNDHLFGSWENRWLERLHRLLVFPVSLTFGAMLFSAPIINHYFEVFNPYTFIANLLMTIPLTIFILTGFSSLILAFIPGLNTAVWGLMNLSGSMVLNLTEWLAAHPWAYYRYHLFAGGTSLGIYYGGLGVGMMILSWRWSNQPIQWEKEPV
ncbi:MAG: ComEC/Rec2 family competence protein [Candidatus Delongbacteria bacterium]|nr:ComEC/Rec2 family competence protein [Candidatus Delongbacteria bacterium]